MQVKNNFYKFFYIGTLSFALNGEFMGVAFRTEQLKKAPLYASVALLHCAGCTLRVGMPKPNYMEWKFNLSEL